MSPNPSKNMKKAIARTLLSASAVVILLIVCACDGSQYLSECSTTLLEYQKHPTQYNLADLSKKYASCIKLNMKRDTLQPGLFADYGVCLALLGKNSEANKMFNNEIAYFPNSARYVRQLKLQLVPEYVADTTADTSTMFDVNLDEFQNDADNNPSSIGADEDGGKIISKEEAKRMREEAKAQRAAEKEEAAKERELIKSIREKEKAFHAEQREAARDSAEQAKAELQKAKEKQKEEKARLKEEKQKQREEAKRMKEEQKAEAQRQKELQREEALRQKELQREEAQRQKELQREEKRKQREEAKRQKEEEMEDEE